MAWFRGPSGRPGGSPQVEQAPTIGRGIYYLAVIMGLQVLLVAGLVAGFWALGAFIATPWWVLLGLGAAGGAGCWYLARKIGRQAAGLRSAMKSLDLSRSNYHISFMGGLVTMTVRREGEGRDPALEAPAPPPAEEVQTLVAPPPASRASR